MISSCIMARMRVIQYGTGESLTQVASVRWPTPEPMIMMAPDQSQSKSIDIVMPAPQVQADMGCSSGALA